jgi:hypothetical protein
MSGMTTQPRRPSQAYRLIRDTWVVFTDGVWWLCHGLWRINRGIVRGMMPGQSKAVHSLVTALVVLLEIVGLWVAATDWAARH